MLAVLLLTAVLLPLGAPAALAELAEVGPINPQNGYPLWYEDSNGLRLELCLDQNGMCLLEEPDPGKPIEFPDNFGPEVFWWAAEAQMSTAGGGRLLLVLATEAAFLNEEPIDGDQISFGRLRIRLRGMAPLTGYRVTHPYGEHTLFTDNRGEARISEDIGCMATPCDFSEALTTATGPFLVWDPDVAPAAPQGYIGDPLVDHEIIGSPVGQNFFRVEGPNAGGLGIDEIETNLFSVMGKIATGAPIADPRGDPITEEANLGFMDPQLGLWHLRGGDGDVTSFFFGNPGDVPFMGDWNCNGVETPGLYRQSDGFVYLRNSNTQGVADIRFYFGNPGDIPLAGDFNGDGCDTVSMYRPSQGQVFIINRLGADEGGLGAAEFLYFFGNPGDKSFVGDFDGDGIDTVGLHRESTGLVYFRDSHTQGVANLEFIFGNPGDRLVSGDWNADGIDSPGVFRPSGSMFFLRHTNTQGPADTELPFGEHDWIPIAGYFGLAG